MLFSQVRSQQSWSLMPSLGIVGAVFPAFCANGFLAFPQSRGGSAESAPNSRKMYCSLRHSQFHYIALCESRSPEYAFEPFPLREGNVA